MNRLQTCEWCHQIRDLTTHHIKDRLGNKEEIIMSGYYIVQTMEVCRPCHDEIERDYELTGKVIPSMLFVRENTLYGIEHNLYPRMANLDQRKKHDIKHTTLWLEKKINFVHKKSRRSQNENKDKFSNLIMKLAIALNDIHTMKLYTSLSMNTHGNQICNR